MKQEFIEIIGARENNLKNIHLRIPKGQITIFTGVSGSGKSSIVFDTIAQEAGRQLNETYSSFTRLFLPRYQRPDVDEIANLATAVVIDQKRLGGNARSTLGTITDINSLLRILFSRFAQPQLGYGNAYSFNDPAGMCSHCQGIGRTITINLETALDQERSLNEGAILLPGFSVGGWQWKTYTESGFFDNDQKLKDYTPEAFQLLVHAASQKVTVPYQNSSINATYEGIATRFMRQNVQTEKETSPAAAQKIAQFTKMTTCPACQGLRYNEKVLTSKISSYSIADLTAVELVKLVPILTSIQIPEAEPVVKSILQRVQALCDIGLGYMDLARETTSLSGGESQRVKMVKHLASSLTGLLYIFDEPSTGLHPRDVYRLNDLLKKLRDQGNTVLVVEHDPDVIKIADFIVDVGPHAGSHGGELMYTGDYAGLLTSDTLTGKYLAHSLPLKAQPRKVASFLSSTPSSRHNLQNVSLEIPEKVLTVVTGVAGSGKSTLVNEVFAAEFTEAVTIDQRAVHTTSRSNPATFIDIMSAIRKVFADNNQVEAGLFSYNSSGACPECKGSGNIELNLSFMDKAEVVCPVCQGGRYQTAVLDYHYQDQNIVDVMAMTVAEALELFEQPAIKRKLASLKTVGLDYLTLGQPLNTLSGGECQRLKLAKELKKKGNLYILDEPTTGLHSSDVENLLKIIDHLVDDGNTVVVIEHNLDVIRQADWLVDLGPDGGSGGGQLLFAGQPKDLATCPRSITGQYL